MLMKGFLFTHKGMEDIASLEVKELIGKESEQAEECVIFDIGAYEDLFKLCYLSQSAHGVFFLLKKCDYKEKTLLSDIDKAISSIDFDEWLDRDTSFRIRCKKKGEETSSEIEGKIGAMVIKHIQEKKRHKQKVDLENPNLAIVAYLNGHQCCIGIDFAGFDLSKRQYRIFSDPSSLKGPLAYFLIRLSSYNRKDSLLDCFAGAGIIPIEAALFSSGFPVNYYNKEKFTFKKLENFSNYNFDKFFKKIDSKINKLSSRDIHSIGFLMKYVQFAKKNSKIAGIDKKISFSRMELEWLDTKFKKRSINKIVTKLPESKRKDLNKIYKEFFYQSEFILAKNGRIAVIGDKDLINRFSKEYNFLVLEGREVFSGSKKYDVFVLGRIEDK